jgi:hypothetical protein
MAARSKAWVCGRSLARFVSVVRYRALRRADHSSRGVLPSVMRQSVIEQPHSRGLGLLGLSSHDKTITSVCNISRCMGPGQRSRYSDSLRVGRSGDRIPVGGEIFHIRPDWPWGPFSPLYNGYWVIPGGKAAGEWR